MQNFIIRIQYNYRLLNCLNCNLEKLLKSLSTLQFTDKVINHLPSILLLYTVILPKVQTCRGLIHTVHPTLNFYMMNDRIGCMNVTCTLLWQRDMNPLLRTHTYQWLSYFCLSVSQFSCINSHAKYRPIEFLDTSMMTLVTSWLRISFSSKDNFK